MSPVLHLKPGTIFAGDFRVVSPLNAGGMGAVYVADQLSTGSQRALKIMLPELLNDQELRERFLREARVCARIPSDHVVQVVAAGIDQPTSTPWLAMELLHGEDLSEYIDRRGAVTPSGLIEIFRQLCHALGAAHTVGVVHRDLKPENIFLAVSKRAGAPFTVKVLDFGIAKMIADASAKMTALIGSPLWMAPEQMDPRQQIAPCTDVWSLCLLAFWLLTGQHYWRSARIKPLSMHAIMREVLFEPLVSATERATELNVGERIPFGFDEWFLRCMVRDTGVRLPNAKQALDDLERCLGNGPRGTMPHPPSYAELQAQQDASIQPEDQLEQALEAMPEAPETVPPTLQSNIEAVEEREPEARVSAPTAPSPISMGPPTSTNGTSSDGPMARRSSIPSMSPLPLKSAAPLWMLAGGLVVLLVVIIVFVRQRTTETRTVTAPPQATAMAATVAPAATSAPAASAVVSVAPMAPAPATVASVATSAPASPSSSASAPSAPQAAPPAPADSPSFPAVADGGGKSFNAAAATAALKSAAASARDCKRSFGPTGVGSVKVTFSPSGSVSSALLLAPQYAGTLVGTCVATQFLKLKIPSFEGTSVTTNMPFEIAP